VKRKRLSEKTSRGVLDLQRAKVVCFFIAIAFLLTAGCGGGSPTSNPPPQAKAIPVAKATADVPKPVVPQPVVPQAVPKQPEVEFVYTPAGKPDPFKPFIQLVPVKELAKNVPMTPLQRYEVSQLKLVAVISTPEGNIGLVEDSAGKGFFLKKGTLIGRNDGKVTKVLNDRVVVEELYQDVLGQTKQSEVSLYLHQPEEGKEP